MRVYESGVDFYWVDSGYVTQTRFMMMREDSGSVVRFKAKSEWFFQTRGGPMPNASYFAA